MNGLKDTIIKDKSLDLRPFFFKMMQEKTHQLRYHEGNDKSVFSSEIQSLIDQTVAFADNAYAPYSKFHVSAGLVLDNGEFLFGTNVENASYPVGICAERTLLGHAVSNYPKNKIITMAVYVDKAVGGPVPPCGICRQSLLEAEIRQGQNFEIILIGKEGSYIKFEKAADLLPLYFEGSVL